MTYIRGYICKNKEINTKCQNYLFSKGCGWGIYRQKVLSHTNSSIIVVDTNNNLYHCSYEGLDKARKMWPLDFSPDFVIKEFKGMVLMETE